MFILNSIFLWLKILYGVKTSCCSNVDLFKILQGIALFLNLNWKTRQSFVETCSCVSKKSGAFDLFCACPGAVPFAKAALHFRLNSQWNQIPHEVAINCSNPISLRASAFSNLIIQNSSPSLIILISISFCILNMNSALSNWTFGYFQKWRIWPKTCSDFGSWRWCRGGPPGLLSTLELENSSWPVNSSQINQTHRWRIKKKKKNDNVK